MTFLEFTFTFTFMILFAALAICGWFIITRGEWHPSPDGTWKKYGMIFKEWSLFWEQPVRNKQERKVYYSGKELAKKWAFLKKVRPDLYEKYQLSAFHESSLMATIAGVVEDKDLEGIKDVLACEVTRDSQKYFRIYQLEIIYMFPSWVRKPLSECPTCMASVYGSAFYWFVVIQAHTLFSWSSKEFLAKFGFWVIFCLILACANKFIDQKMKL